MKGKRLAAIIWTVAIILACSIPGRDLPELEIDFLDKIGHLAMFAGYGALWMAATAGTNVRRATIVGGTGVLLAIGSELYQGLLPWERTPDVFDALADCAGLAVGILMHVFVSGRQATS